jgi:hypothetical protein
MTKAETLAALKNQMDSFYSLEQVIKIFEGIDPEPETNVLTEELCNTIMDNIENCLNRGSDFIDLSSAEFELGYDGKSIELSTVELDVNEIMHSIGRVFDELKSENNQ